MTAAEPARAGPPAGEPARVVPPPAADKGVVLAYFAAKADRYDEVDEQVYWRLSDELLWDLLTERALAGRAGVAVADLGAGTGRWSDRVLRRDPAARALYVDISAAMLAVARAKARRHGYLDRVAVEVADLDSWAVPPARAGAFDLVLCLHNVAALVADVDRLVATAATLLRPGGTLVLMAPNLHHMQYFTLAVGWLDEAERLAGTGRGRYVEGMPAFRAFTPDSLAARLADRFTVDLVTGFPVLLYPGTAETSTRGSSAGYDTWLREPATFARVLELERRAMRMPGVAARGANLVAVATRGRGA
jgi:SAM-dependent methyltransferase